MGMQYLKNLKHFIDCLQLFGLQLVHHHILVLLGEQYDAFYNIRNKMLVLQQLLIIGPQQSIKFLTKDNLQILLLDQHPI
jgi:hypothetical protein